MKSGSPLALALALVASPGLAHAQAPVFEGIDGTAAGMTTTRALGVSGDGNVVVGQGNVTGGIEAFRFTAAGGVVSLGDLAGGNLSSNATGASFDGAVIAGTGQVDDPLMELNSRSEAFRALPGGGLTGLGDLTGGSYNSVGTAVSADGSVLVGNSLSASGIEAFRWTLAGGLVGLGDIAGGGFSSTANGVSADGSVVVGTGTPGLLGFGTHPFRWSEAQGVEDLGFTGTGTDVSADGLVVVGQDTSTGNSQAFRWTEPLGIERLGDLEGGNFDSFATATSADGSVVVGRAWSTAGIEAFVWDAANGMRSLKTVLIDDYGADVAGWDLTVANGVSADGTVIVGQGFDPLDQERGWIARLPEPAGLLAPLAAAFALAALRRARRDPVQDARR